MRQTDTSQLAKSVVGVGVGIAHVDKFGSYKSNSANTKCFKDFAVYSK